MDTGDFESAVERANGGGALALRISSALQRWKEWGYIRTVSYPNLLPPDKRKAIAALSKKIVRDLISQAGNDLPRSKFIKLTTRGHQDYATYLEQSMMASTDDRGDFQKYKVKWLAVAERLRQLKMRRFTDKLLEKLALSSERSFSKIIAGIIIALRLGESCLYETEEYAPRFLHLATGRLMRKSHLRFANVGHVTDTLDSIVAAMTDQPVADVGFTERSEFFDLLKDGTELHSMKINLQSIGCLLAEIAGQKRELANRIIRTEILRMRRAYNDGVARYSRLKDLNTIGSRFVAHAPVIGPYAADLLTIGGAAAKAAGTQSVKRAVAGSSMSSALSFFFNLWSRQSRYRKLRDLRRQLMKETPPASTSHTPRKFAYLWGESEARLYWYEVG